jgi:hypothetical protein
MYFDGDPIPAIFQVKEEFTWNVPVKFFSSVKNYAINLSGST